MKKPKTDIVLYFIMAICWPFFFIDYYIRNRRKGYTIRESIKRAKGGWD